MYADRVEIYSLMCYNNFVLCDHKMKSIKNHYFGGIYDID